MKPIRRRFPWAFLAKRVAYGALAMLVIAIINFFLLKLAPGDAAEALAGQAGTADPAYIAQLRAQFGLDQPLLSQLWAFLVRLATLDLGYSYVFNERVSVLIFSRMPATLMLMGAAIVIAVIGGIVFGVTAARYANRWPDRVISFVALLLYGTPPYWIGLMMILIFAVTLGWTPTSGMENVLAFNTGWDRVVDIAHHLILPALAQSIFYLAIYIRLVRAGMLEVLSLDFIRVARAKGISERRLSYRHALRNAVIPVVTVVGLQMGALLSGAIVIETVFAWPGIGRLAVQAVSWRDYPVVQAVVLVSASLFIILNLIVDLLYRVIDPRMRHA